MGKKNKNPYDTFCGICGYPLYLWQVGTTLEGLPTDYVMKERVEIEFDVCTECWEGIKTNAGGGMKKAIERKKALKQFDKVGK